MSDASTPEQIIAELGYTLPEAPPPAASYLPFAQTGDLVLTAGQIAVSGGELIAKGRVGVEVDMEKAIECAELCGINVIAQIKAACGDLSKVDRIVKLTVFVSSGPDFVSQHLVANGASELMAKVFGEAGRHARSAVGVPRLPLDSPVEVEAIVRLKS